MKKIANYPVLAISLAISGYLLITLLALTSQKHILYNLEPYPDGILYALSARNAALGKGLELAYQGTHLPLWVPPFYSLVLTPGYLISSSPWMFYVTNCLLGAATLFCLYYLVSRMTQSRWGGVIAVTAYLSHIIVVWLPTVPMTENVTVLLLLLALLPLLIIKPSRWMYIIGILAICGLVFTRYAVFPLSMSLSVLLFIQWNRQEKSRVSWVAVIMLAVLSLALQLSGFSLISKLSSLGKAVFLNPQFYSLNFALTNSKVYLLSLVGIQGPFLWLRISITSLFLSFPAVWCGITQWRSSKADNRWKATVILTAFFMQFPLQLIFYTIDYRYVILSIPLISIMCGWLFTELQRYKLGVGWYVMVPLLCLHLLTQSSSIKELVSNNILHRSVAWQYQAIEHFNTYFSSNEINNPLLITALPPHLIDSYKTANYRVLPLSPHQEHMQKGEHVWGNDINYDHLRSQYHEWLKKDKQLFITNAYITHQQSVIQDFEDFKQDFNLELVSDGCLSACSIYKLSEKEATISSSIKTPPLSIPVER